jgi:hypothetical protein
MKSAPEPPKPPSPKGSHSHAGAEATLTSPSHVALSHVAAGTCPRPEPVEFHKVSPLSPQSYGLSATGGPRHSKGSSDPQSEKQP